MTPVSPLHKLVVWIVLSTSLVLGLFLSYRDSMTTDEGIHVASAYLAVKRGEFRFDPEHPYLFKLLTALPLLPMKLNMPPEDQKLWEAGYPTTFDSWEKSRLWSDQWFYISGNNATKMIFWARVPSVLLTLFFCWLINYLGRLWFSARVGLFALVFTAYNPTVIGHGHLTGNDVAAALAFLGTLWALWYYTQKRDARRALILGLCFGAAQLTKFSLLTLVPVVFIWLLYLAYTQKAWKQTGRDFLIVAATTWIMIWLAYLGPLSLIHGTAFQIKGTEQLDPILKIDQQAFHKFLYIRYFLPVDYVKGVMLILGGSIAGRPTYLLGHFYSTGTHVWEYFPTVYFLKTQLIGLFLLISGTLAGLLSMRNKKGWRTQPLALILLLGAFVYLAFSLNSKINIGVRHVLPLMGLASFAMALSLERILKVFNRSRWIGATVLGLYTLPIIISFPNYIGYTNIFVQPPKDAYYYFGDSNLDWGQQTRDIARTMREQFPGETLYIDYRWNPYGLNYFGLKTHSLKDGPIPTGAVVAITATDLEGEKFIEIRKREPAYILYNHTFFYRFQPGDF